MGARHKSCNDMGTLASRRRVPENAGGTSVFPVKPEVFTTFTARTPLPSPRQCWYFQFSQKNTFSAFVCSRVCVLSDERQKWQT